jgi:hypothetical protein
LSNFSPLSLSRSFSRELNQLSVDVDLFID